MGVIPPIMEGIHMLRDLLMKGDYLVRLDLQDVYFSVPVCAEHQTFLRFLGDGTLWEFSYLPFGLASTPRTFTKIMKPVVPFLRNLGIRMIIYLDNILIFGNTVELLKCHLTSTQNLLEHLGFIANLKKSVLFP